MPALIKVDEIAQNLKHFYMEKIFKNGAIFWEQAHCVCTDVKMAAKWPFSLATPQIDEAMDHSETPF